jgi:hypothetical protein
VQELKHLGSVRLEIHGQLVTVKHHGRSLYGIETGNQFPDHDFILERRHEKISHIPGRWIDDRRRIRGSQSLLRGHLPPLVSNEHPGPWFTDAGAAGCPLEPT